MNKKKVVLIFCLVIGICFIFLGSVAYYRMKYISESSTQNKKSIWILSR